MRMLGTGSIYIYIYISVRYIFECLHIDLYTTTVVFKSGRTGYRLAEFLSPATSQDQPGDTGQTLNFSQLLVDSEFSRNSFS